MCVEELEESGRVIQLFVIGNLRKERKSAPFKLAILSSTGLRIHNIILFTNDIHIIRKSYPFLYHTEF